MKTKLKLKLGVLGAAVAWGTQAVHGIGSGGLLQFGHVDCSINYINGQWVAGYRHEPDANPLDPNAPADGPLLDLESTVLLARDQPFEVGSRVLRPTPPEWDFLGPLPGRPLWWFPQTNWAQGNYVGFSISGPFAVYQETDPRLAGSGPQKWARIQAVSQQYRGKGAGRFSVWTNSTASGLKVWVDSRDGFQETDRYFVGDNSHAHPAFGFTALGLYKVGFQGRAWLDVDRTKEVVSPVYPSYIAVGTYAIWIAENFSPTRWFQPVISGENADPDEDGISNLMEYACGLNPRTSDAESRYLPAIEALEGGSFLVKTRQRSGMDNPQLRYQWEEADRPDAVEWTAVEPLSREGIDGKWEQVHYVMAPPAPDDPERRRYGRLRVELLESLTYP
jgi:hypothetical protein